MTEQAKSTTPSQESTYPAPQTVAPYPHQTYNTTAFPPPGPPGAYMPPIFAYPPPPDGNHPEGQNGAVPAPYMIPMPPGVLYYPPHPQAPGFGPPPANAASPTAARPKRKQVKMACTNCANACKRCDENRPCERCVKYGTADSCIDGTRKERKKGIKRGPYKRKNKEQGEGSNFSAAEWPNGQPPTSVTPAAPIHAATPPYVPEGYYPVYYPPFIPHPHEGQPGSDGTPPHSQPVVPYFIHPGPYPPFPYTQLYPHPPGAAATSQPPTTPAATSSQTSSTAPQPSGSQQQQSEPPTTINPADATRKDSPAGGENTAVVDPALTGPDPPTTIGKKRSKTKSGEPKAKKARTNGSTREKGKEGDVIEAQSALNDGDT